MLYIDNSVGDLKNDVWHKVVYEGADSPMVRLFSLSFSDRMTFSRLRLDLRNAKDQRCLSRESRTERFPRRCSSRTNVVLPLRLHVLVKDLTITVSTTRTVNEVSLLADTTQLSAINTRERVLCETEEIDTAGERYSRCIYRSTRMASSRTCRDIDEVSLESIYSISESTSCLFCDV